jgi:hypothetical protein
MKHIYNVIKFPPKKLIIIIVTFSCFVASGCDNSSNNLNESETSKEAKYRSGTYCAEVTYYNPNTSTRKTYILNVEIENKELTKIYWSNGGWLDESHFTPPEMSDRGTCTFTSDKGYKYDVEITGQPCTSTSSKVVLEGEDEPKEFTLTVGECASAMHMEESELSEYEDKFNVSRKRIITESMCNSLHEYYLKKREFDESKRSLKSLENLIDNGYIQKRFSIGSDGDIRCQTMIVKRRGYFYLLEVQGTKQATMGLMDFEPGINDWQEVIIVENPSNPIGQVFNIRVIDQSPTITALAERMETLCKYE